MEYRKWKIIMENRKWKMKNDIGKWIMKNGKWKMGSLENQLFPQQIP